MVTKEAGQLKKYNLFSKLSIAFSGITLVWFILLFNAYAATIKADERFPPADAGIPERNRRPSGCVRCRMTGPNTAEFEQRLPRPSAGVPAAV